MNLFRSLLCVLILAVTAVSGAQTVSELREHVTYLASDALRGRDTGSKGYTQAAKYVYEHCQEYGLQVEYQRMSTSRGECKNVIAWIEGRQPETVIVVGAHLDHIGVSRNGRAYNGADDNASGSAGVLGLAKRFAENSKPQHTITFQFYTGEERGFLGSGLYVRYPLLPENAPSIKKHIFMLNLDMIGRLRVRQRMLNSDPDLPAILTELYRKYPYARGITLSADSGSDHIKFHRAGMPVVFLHTGSHADYHRTTDDADKINYAGMVKVCDYAYDLLNMVMGEVPDYKIWSALPVYKGRP